MDIFLHQRQYFQALAYDPLVGGKDWAWRDQGPVMEALQAQANALSDAMDRGDAPAYWKSLEGHQAALLELQERNTAALLPAEEKDPLAVLDFIQKYGWRRFRFGSQILRIQLRIDGELWALSVLPSYRERHLKKLKEFDALEGKHVVLDAVEMENFLRFGDPEKARRMLTEKLADPETPRHILWGDENNPQFVKLALKRSNSSLHVGDWSLPLRS